MCIANDGVTILAGGRPDTVYCLRFLNSGTCGVQLSGQVAEQGKRLWRTDRYYRSRTRESTLRDMAATPPTTVGSAASSLDCYSRVRRPEGDPSICAPQALATYTRIDPSHVAAFSPTVIRLLRDGIHLGGVIASDSLTAANVPPVERAIEFLSAGGPDRVEDRGCHGGDCGRGPRPCLLGSGLRRQGGRRRPPDPRGKEAAGLLPCSGGLTAGTAPPACP